MLTRTAKFSCKGFTLVETVLGMVVMSIVILAFASIARVSVDSYSLIVSRKEAMTQARNALNRITQELVSISPAAITAIDATSISFNDTLGAPSNFRSQSTNGLLQIFRGNDLLANNINYLTFTYYDANGNVIADGNIANMRRILVDLGVNSANGNSDMKMRGEVYPRNYYYTNYQ